MNASSITQCRSFSPRWQIQFAEVGALRPEDPAAAQQQLRRRMLRWFPRGCCLACTDARRCAGSPWLEACVH